MYALVAQVVAQSVIGVAAPCHQHSESDSVHILGLAPDGSHLSPSTVQKVFGDGICSQVLPPW